MCVRGCKTEQKTNGWKEAEDAPVIVVDRLTARFGDETILENVSFDVFRGEILCIVGESGCGKSTLLKHMIGLIRSSKGRVLVGGVDIAAADDDQLNLIRQKIGVLFQSDALLASMTLGENVKLPLDGFVGLSPETVQLIVRMKLGMVNLSGYENHYPAELSGGMRKRGGLARAIALDPQILFFDEPSAGLDPVNAAELETLIRGINTGLCTTMVIVSHQVELVLRIADRVMMIDREEKGIIATGAPEELRRSASDPRVRNFLFRVDAERRKG
ncbi:MAG: polyamine ABC transporter ATP-binding protein [Syntrophus sp. (in: bacteria)]|nr:polyamine ABC transporter ATP-binding protein [Syntrophus sp. (in: bacteria)]